LFGKELWECEKKLVRKNDGWTWYSVEISAKMGKRERLVWSQLSMGVEGFGRWEDSKVG